VSDQERFESARDPLAIVETVPVAGATDIAADAAIELCFSHTIDPRSLAPADATMSSGSTPIDAETTLQLRPWTNPGGTPADADTPAPWCEGSVLSVRPRALLFHGLRYRLRLVPRARGWNGEILDTDADGWTSEGPRRRYTLEFIVAPSPDPQRDDTGPDDTGPDDTGPDDTGPDDTGPDDTGPDDTGPDDTNPPPLQDGPTLTELFEPGAVFDPERPTCSCHRDTDDLALARLDLRDPLRAYAGLVLDVRPRETGFVMVSPRRPSESFLVQKLLRDEHDDRPLRGILGDAMPPDAPIPYADYVMIARWIAAGALP